MPRFLVALSLGPVQSLIADARRTRDLWCGSWLLSEAARASARVLHERQPGCLIFPCPDDPDKDLEPQDEPVDGANIANVLRADVTLADAGTVLALCNEAKSAAIARVTALGEQARRRLEHPIRTEVWRAQIGHILEVFAGWAEIGDGGYADAGRRLARALNARKATRDFRPCEPLRTPGLRKSSLDGALETVLPERLTRERARAKLALSPGEQLDALGLVKRLAGNAEQFTAWPRIAADPWIQGLAPGQQQGLRAAYAPLAESGLATRVAGNAGTYAALPYDGHLLYPSRLSSVLTQERERRGEEGYSSRIEALEAMQKCVTDISRERTDAGQPAGVPVSYAAVLKADGDRMGRLLSRAESADRSREISRLLRAFASDVRRIVRNHRGDAVYAGGDDVLALVPLAQALGCARDLAKAFAASLGGIAKSMQLSADERPTLSVGLGIGYVVEPLGALRALAERAEQHAKGDATETPRDALAIQLRIRSGSELRWRAQWKDKQAFDALLRFAAAYRAGELPTRAAYDLREIDRRLGWLRDDDSETARGMRKADVERTLDRARRSGGGRTIPAELRALIRERTDNQSLAELADTLIIARWLAAHTAADVGEQP